MGPGISGYARNARRGARKTTAKPHVPAIVKEKAAERRRAERTPLKLGGRYMLSDGVELQCRTIDVSVTGVALEGYIAPDLGEHVIVYLDELGRIEGNVARRGDGWFAIDARTSQSRIRRIEEKIAALSGKSPETLGLAAHSSPRRSAILRTDFGQEFSVQVSDESPTGATVSCNAKLLPGTRVTIDGERGIVGLEGHEGFLVEFAKRPA